MKSYIYLRKFRNLTSYCSKSLMVKFASADAEVGPEWRRPAEGTPASSTEAKTVQRRRDEWQIECCWEAAEAKPVEHWVRQRTEPAHQHDKERCHTRFRNLFYIPEINLHPSCSVSRCEVCMSGLLLCSYDAYEWLCNVHHTLVFICRLY